MVKGSLIDKKNGDEGHASQQGEAGSSSASGEGDGDGAEEHDLEW